MFKQSVKILCASLSSISIFITLTNAAGSEVHPGQHLQPEQLSKFKKTPPSAEGKGIQAMAAYSNPQQSGTQAIISTFIREGVEQHPLPVINVVQEELLSSGLILNIGETITKAYNNNPASMLLLGSLYLNLLDIEKAQSFLFRAALLHNPDAVWALSSMCRNKHIQTMFPNIETILLNEAERLGSTDAKIYKQESGL